ncbi:MAG TPA: M20/M25/M40 family metallo-hydrolase [Candidatus Saccharimonadales bacterium]|nr:M20/M25/M40 family metallo-hydrolase [Candidatus Saccharimonadales bacterium]
MTSRRITLFAMVVVLILAVGRGGSAQPGAAEASAFAGADAKILAEIRDNSEAMKNSEYLGDSIGPRLTGSPQLKQANDWTAEMFKKYGLTNVHLESWSIAHSWTRGAAQARITAPAEHPLTIAAAGWSPSTQGLVRGPVVYVDVKKKEDLEQYRGRLKGAIVILQEPGSLSPPKPEDFFGGPVRPMQEPPRMKGEPATPSPFEGARELAKLRTDFLVQEGVAAVLRDSNKPHALLNMTGIGGEKFDKGTIPTAFITGEGYRMLFRMLKHGPVEVEIGMTNTFSDKPVDVYNTVAEIKGTEKPEEVVILGAHLDSWDLGTGSTDNGTGSMAVLEAARALAKLDLKPKRTIRFILFSGEEEGLCGSEAYVQAHQDELEKISGVLVHDTGTGKVLTLALHDNYQDRAIVDQVLAPLKELRLQEPTMMHMSGTDHLSFNNVGVPGFWALQDGAEYSKTHHSQSDTFDKVWADDLNQGAQVLAAWAYNTAQLPAMLPRRPLPYRPSPDVAKAEASLPNPIADADKKILDLVKGDQDVMKANLQYLADRIGPRLTGSPQLDQASHWTMEQFKQMGLSNVHLEPWTIANGWTRGPATGRVTAPTSQNLTLAAMGWSPSTKGTVHGRVVGLAVEKPEDLEQYKGKLKGAIVLLGKPVDMLAPGNPLTTPWAEGTLPINFPKLKNPVDRKAVMALREAENKFFGQEKVGAVLYASEKSFGLLNMGGGRGYAPAAVPSAMAARENYLLLWRLLDAGPVEAEVNIESSFTGKPATVYNTVAEIPGSVKPDEVVIIGGHLDSWDLGTGATDNGTGSSAVLEAARALMKSGLKPKRTIRFVLFTGEEQGLNGSKAYVKAHTGELAKISGVLVHDTGTGKVLTIGLMGNYDVRETIDRAIYPLGKAVGLAEPTLRSEGGSDHVPFDEAGVPGFWSVQEVADYDRMHHSQADTVDHVRWDNLTEGAQVLAVFAYNVAQLPGLLPRKAKANQ